MHVADALQRRDRALAAQAARDARHRPAASSSGSTTSTPARVKRELNAALDQFKTGNGRGAGPVARTSSTLIREAWVLASLEYGAGTVRSGHLLAALLNDRNLRHAAPRRRRRSWPSSPPSSCRRSCGDLLAARSTEETTRTRPRPRRPAAAGERRPAGAAESKTPALDQFTMNLTERAKAGQDRPGRRPRLRDPPGHRHPHAPPAEQPDPHRRGRRRQDRRRRRVRPADRRRRRADAAQERAAPHARPGLLQAGAGVKGEFENRLKSVHRRR